MTYREPSPRPELPDDQRRWFTKQGDESKGPYTRDVLARSLRSGVLKRTSLVRAEGEPEWRAIYTVPALVAAASPVGTAKPAGWTPDPRDVVDPGADGSFGGGFAAGFFGGVIGLVIVRVMAKGAQTKTGATVGFAVGLFVGILVRVLAH